MDKGAADSVVLLLKNLYLHSDRHTDEIPQHPVMQVFFEAGMQQVIRNLSPKTHAAVEELGPDPVYTFFRAEFGEPE